MTPLHTARAPVALAEAVCEAQLYNTVGLSLVRLKYVSKEADSYAYTHHRTVQSAIFSICLGGVILCPGLQTSYYVRIYA